jgi:hypothetical protein
LSINPDKISGTSPRARTDIMTNQNTPVTGTVYAYLCPPVLCLLKPITHVCTIKMAEDWLGTYSAFPMTSMNSIPSMEKQKRWGKMTIQSKYMPYLASSV